MSVLEKKPASRRGHRRQGRKATVFFGYPFRLTGANEPIIKKIFQNVKKFGTKILHVHLDIFCLYTNFQKKEHFLCPIKRQIYV
jgi:hypothetical protein